MDVALTAAEAQMGRECLEESLEGNPALAGDLLGEEDGEWLVALRAATAPPPGVCCRAGKGLLSLSRGRHRPRGTRGNQGQPWGRG